MSKIRSISYRDVGIIGYVFWCLGCDERHAFYTKAYRDGGNPVWSFNNDLDRPTFSPSLLITSGHFMQTHKERCWCTHNEELIAKGEEPARFVCVRCHLFLTDGKLIYLSDSSHKLSGQTVDLVDLER